MAPKSKKTAGEKHSITADLRAKTADELKDQLVGLKKEQFNLRFQLLEAPAQIRKVRRDIARVKTILGQKSAAK